ncbi:uncharacterized protein LOC124275125 isoform X2 [Haliotis rubra]|uniref:uncharacterized protein LOC124275125 isoform X2 n=1 Tax=Haliotis rubra TaxID=36100 RepID=UPI001EE5A04B|nr:uncharacterized protein LOC124275125 isoform X2 [Haliotis rubra]
MCTHLCVLLCVIASVQRGTAQGGARPSDSVLLTSVTSLKNEGTELKGVSGAIKDALYFDVHVSAPSYSAIQQDMVDTVSEAGVFKLQINSFKAAMQDFINKAKSRGHSNDALMSELNKIAGYFHELLVQTAAVVTHAQGIASQLQGGKVVG